jgi:hypothetical protein
MPNNLFAKDFPYSRNEPFRITSKQTPEYNCIAWAYGCDDRKFWPDPYYYWPENIERKNTIENFIKLFEGIGYSQCDNGKYEDCIEKVAIYVGKDGKPTHAARQLEGGRWTSKLGDHHDVSHTINSMKNGFYGNVEVYMARPRRRTEE